MFKTKIKAKKAIINTRAKKKEKHHIRIKKKKTGETMTLWFKTPPKQTRLD